jgi:hypothetical protein
MRTLYRRATATLWTATALVVLLVETAAWWHP